MNFPLCDNIFNQLTINWNICINFKGGEAWNQMANFTAHPRQLLLFTPPNPNLYIHGGANV